MKQEQKQIEESIQRISRDVVMGINAGIRTLDDLQGVLEGDLVFQNTWEPKDDEWLPEWII